MAATRLERSCAPAGADWLAGEAPARGVARLRARLQRAAYAPHRHDTYTVSLTEHGVQEFGYRGTVHRSLPGQVAVLHPDETHDGRPGTAQGFGYRSLYLEPGAVFEAVRAVAPRHGALPFVRTPVCHAPGLARLIGQAFDGPLEPLAADGLLQALAGELVRMARGGANDAAEGRAARVPIDLPALARAHDYLGTHCRRVVSSQELERVSGLSRFVLCVQFRQRYGTSPYRFLLMRRLDRVREWLAQGMAPAAVAADAGFADQAHMTRAFKAAFGLTPSRYAALQAGSAAV